MKSITIAGRWKIFHENSLPDEIVFSSIEDVLSQKLPNDWMQIKSSTNTRTWQFIVGSSMFFFKEYLSRSYYENLKALLAGTRARRAWVNGKILAAQGFHTPHLLFYGEKKHGIFPSRNFLVTEYIADSSASFVFFRNHFCPPLSSADLQRKRQFIRSLGHEIGKLHKRGIYHGDLRPGNILVTSLKDIPVFYFIDNERNKYFQNGIPTRLRMKNLVQINMIAFPEITFTDRLRFFQAYLNENEDLKPHAKSWLHKLFLTTKKRLEKIFPGIWNTAR